MQYAVSDGKKKELPEGFLFRENANVRLRTTDPRSAVNQYFKFCKERSTLSGIKDGGYIQ